MPEPRIALPSKEEVIFASPDFICCLSADVEGNPLRGMTDRQLAVLRGLLALVGARVKSETHRRSTEV
jgi:hypothetical protein